MVLGRVRPSRLLRALRVSACKKVDAFGADVESEEKTGTGSRGDAENAEGDGPCCRPFYSLGFRLCRVRVNPVRRTLAVLGCAAALISCRYQFGTATSGLAGSYCVESIENRTDYRLFSSDLQARLVEVLRRQKNVHLAKREEAQALLRGTLLSVQKLDRERNERGIVMEVQFIVEMDLRVEGESGNKTLHVRNTDFRGSSGTYRVDRGGSEAQATRDALADLAEAAVLALAGGW